MFKKILIANRGEIACRIIATCRRLGIATVAVHSEADAGARHVRLADRSVCIGPAAAAESYLGGERILAAARAHGAEAIHPGYGFLSENPDFARAVEGAGLALIGPSAETMELMGSKAAAKAKMAPAGIPLIPGYHGADQSDATLAREAARIGFPLMLKAAAGGGGKGMRVVRSETDLGEALQAARRESAGAFGDERMILERYLERPRHIEAQVFADVHGNTVHLFERDCSSQRRHQKIIEEAPAPGLNPRVRDELLAAAVRAAEAVNYRGAGTVEFLVDGDDFFFLEMNTRLQVEHPVTEMITGLDLVEWQLRVAAGEPLPLAQEKIRAHGHAMEARIYAEDPARGFVPSSGQVHRLTLPEGRNVRVDSGIEQGDTVSMHYDPMIAKLIVHAANREACRTRLQNALAACFIAGPTTNLGFLQALAASDDFARASVDTGLLDREPASVNPQLDPPAETLAAASAYWLLFQEQAASGPSPWDRCDGWRLGASVPRSLDIECHGRRWLVEASGHGGDYCLGLDEAKQQVRLEPLGDSRFRLAMASCSDRLWIHAHDDFRLDVCFNQRRWTLTRHARFQQAEASGPNDGRLLAPMPGKILEIRAWQGGQVKEGETLMIMEAMKMELAIKAPFDGRVEQLAVEAGNLVEADAWLLTVA
ncbi:MAG: acetyl-CoA carboxylase biotin carboxylase subunit [Wenzhouxiangella sp.]|nr:MAG: acetyl-CoA carboxylase biotin carboxylase subunit [Wenzhouxiangella sp.]